MSDYGAGINIYQGKYNQKPEDCWKCARKAPIEGARFVSFDTRDPSDGAWFCIKCYETEF
jgi:hypothetical protein